MSPVGYAVTVRSILDDPRYAEAHANLALALGRLGRYADAQRHLEQARAILLSRTR